MRRLPKPVIFILLAALVCVVAVSVLVERQQTVRPRPPEFRTVPISSDPYPRLILRTGSYAITNAAYNATTVGTRPRAIYDDTKAAVTSINEGTWAVESAFVYRVEQQIGSPTTDDNNYGYRALNWVYNTANTGYVQLPENDPATVWASYGSGTLFRYMAGEYISWVTLVADWTDNLSSSTKRTAIREWLCEWSNQFAGYYKSLNSSHYDDYAPRNIAAWGLLLMEISGKSTGTCTLAVPGGAAYDAEAKLQEVISFVTGSLHDYWPNGYYYQEGPHYDDLNIQEYALFLAAAEGAGYLNTADTSAVNYMDGVVSQAIPPGKFFQWADTVEADVDNATHIPPQLVYLMHVSGDKPEYYWLWDTYRTGSERSLELQDGGHGVTGGIPLYLSYYSLAAHATAAPPSQLSMFMRDDSDGGGDPVGGILSFRDTWSSPALDVNFINRYSYHTHSHYDYSGIEIAYGGDRFVVDHSSDYATETHGEALEQNHVIYYDSTAAQWGNLPTNDQSVNEGDQASVYGEIKSWTDYGTSGLALYSDHRYPLVNPLYQCGSAMCYYSRDQLTPAPVGRRLVLMSRAAGQPPVLAVFDRNKVGTAKDWRVLWNTRNGLTATGNGSELTPLKLVGPSGATLYAFVPGGSMSMYDRHNTTPNGYTPNNAETETLSHVYYTEQDQVDESIFSTIWFASPNGAPTMTAETINGRQSYKVNRPGFTSWFRYVPNPTRATLTYGRVTTDAEAMLLEYDGSNALTAAQFANYTVLQDNGATIDTGTGQTASIAYSGSGFAGQVSGSALAASALSGQGATDTPTPTPTSTPTKTPTPIPSYGTLTVYGWGDDDRDHAEDTAFEPRLAPIRFWISSSADPLVEVTACTVTDETIPCSFSLPAGQYIINVSASPIPADYKPSAATTVVIVGNGSTLTYGYRFDPTGPTPTPTPIYTSLHVWPYYDANNNGIYDNGEGLAGGAWSISKWEDPNTVYHYCGEICWFDEIDPGSYIIREIEAPDGYAPRHASIIIAVPLGPSQFQYPNLPVTPTPTVAVGVTPIGTGNPHATRTPTPLPTTTPSATPTATVYAATRTPLPRWPYPSRTPILALR